MIAPIQNVATARLWIERIAYAIMVACATIGLLFAVAAVYAAYFNGPPVHVESLDKPPKEPLCPGDPLPINNHVTVDRPTILSLYVSVMDEDANVNIPDTAISLGVRLHPHPTTFVQSTAWIVPNLPPGNYNRTLAVRGHDTDEDVIYNSLPFTVAEDCP